MGQESGSSLDAWFWLKVSHEVVVKPLAGGVISSEISTGEGSASNFTYMVVR